MAADILNETERQEYHATIRKLADLLETPPTNDGPLDTSDEAFAALLAGLSRAQRAAVHVAIRALAATRD